MSKTLIAVSSNSGLTMALARALSVKTGYELFRINPAKIYPKGFASCVFSFIKERICHEKALVMGKPQNLASYDRVVLCFPIWGSTIPPVVKTFLEENDFAGKTIIPVCTYMYSKGHCDEDIRKLCPDSDVDTCIEASKLKDKAVGTIYDYIKAH